MIKGYPWFSLWPRRLEPSPVHREHLGSLVYSKIRSRKCVLGPQLWNLVRELIIERTVFSMQTSILLYSYLPRYHLDTSFFFGHGNIIFNKYPHFSRWCELHLLEIFNYVNTVISVYACVSIFLVITMSSWKKSWKTSSLKKRGDWKVATFYAGVCDIPFPPSFEDGMKQWLLIEVRWTISLLSTTIRHQRYDYYQVNIRS